MTAIYLVYDKLISYLLYIQKICVGQGLIKIYKYFDKVKQAVLPGSLDFFISSGTNHSDIVMCN